MVRPLLTENDEVPDPRPVPEPPRWVRGVLVLMVAALGGVFVIARLLNPYEADGTPRRQGTHQQAPLGLPPCTFHEKTGYPCPSCGMTTSFALLVRGDVKNSLRANAVGTLLAVVCAGLIPYVLHFVIRKRPLLGLSLERVLTWVVLLFLGLMMLRWVVVLAFREWSSP